MLLVPSGEPEVPGVGEEGAAFYTWVETVGNTFWIGGGGSGNALTGEASYNPPYGINSAGWQATEGLNRIIVPGKFKLKGVAFDASGSAGSGKSYTQYARINRSEDTLPVKIEGTSETSKLAEGSVQLKAGDTIEAKLVPSGTPTARSIRYCYLVESEASGEMFAGGTVEAAESSNLLVRYGWPDTWKATWGTTSAHLPRPVGLKFERLYVEIGTAPDVGKSRIYEHLKLPFTATGLKVKIEGAATSGNDTTHSFVTDGERMTMSSTPSGTPAENTGGVHWGFVVIVPQPFFAALGKASEADTAGKVARQKSRALGKTSETDASRPLVRAKVRMLGVVFEVDVARPITKLKARPLGQATETEQARPIDKLKARPLGQANETEQAEAVASFKTLPIGPTSETDSASPIPTAKSRGLGQALETSVAYPIEALHGGLLGQAFETNFAFPIMLRVGHGGTAALAEESVGGAIVVDEPMGGATLSEEP
jgi:hypothetical protein